MAGSRLVTSLETSLDTALGTSLTPGGIATATSILGSKVFFEMRADQGISIDGSDDVTAVADISGYNDLGVGNNAPHYNASITGSMSLSLPAIEFSRANGENLWKAGTLANLSAGDQPQFYMLMETIAYNNDAELIDVDSGEHRIGTWKHNGWVLSSCGSYALNASTFDNDPHLLAVDYDGVNVAGRVDEGSPVNTANTSTASAPSGLALGSNSVNNKYADAYMYWVVCLNAEPTTAERAELIAAMQAYQASGA